MKIEKKYLLYTNIIQVGLGGTGSNLLPFLTQLINQLNDKSIYLTIIDGDIVENKNLRNQKYTELDISKPKAEVLCERYKAVYPELNISYINKYIKSENDILEHIENKSLNIIIGCVDNNATRQILHKVFYNENVADIIYIDAGNGTEQRIGQIVTGYKKGVQKQVPPYDYFQTKRLPKEIILKPVGDIFPEILNDNDNIDKVLSCSNISNEVPQNIATNVYAATLLFTVLTNIIMFNEIKSHTIYFDAETGSAISRI